MIGNFLVVLDLSLDLLIWDFFWHFETVTNTRGGGVTIGILETT